MNINNQFKVRLFKFFIFIMIVTGLSACSKDNNPAGPEGTNISGHWEGPFNHPSYYSGYLKMDINQNNGSLSGSFTVTLFPGYSQGKNYTGNITGNNKGNDSYNLTLINSQHTWVCSLELNADTLSGGWVAAGESVSGTLSAIKDQHLQKIYKGR